jgi:hypothetical protein
MAALDIPGVGENLGKHIRIMTFGAVGESPDVAIGSGTGTTALVNINEPNVFVESIESQVVLAIATAGSLVAMTIGDGDDVDGYWTDTLQNVAATSAVFANQASSLGYFGGKLYTVTDTIDLKKVVAKASVGKVRLRVRYWRGVDTNLNPATST